ncbi:MAG TPA: cyclase family protein [Candidatus Bathyarchaeia archaeon]|nr:cyclase family protein [Candidatus Bathyarchaeia archaeon]
MGIPRDLDVRALGRRISTWGRFGKDDVRGALNYITPQGIRRAAGLVKRGAVFSLALPLSSDGPQVGKVGRNNPVHFMSVVGDKLPGGFTTADDWVVMPLQCGTQWDCFAHGSYDDTLYNGVPGSTVTAHGSSVIGIERWKSDVVARGVLVDIARLRGVERLQIGEAILPEELDRALAAQKVAVEPGDVLLVRTGWITVFTRDGDKVNLWEGEPGLSVACAEWLATRQVAAVAADNFAVEVYPGEIDTIIPLHMLLLRDAGIVMGELFDLEELAADCARDGIYEFLFVAPVLPITGAVGTPINPLAIK